MIVPLFIFLLSINSFARDRTPVERTVAWTLTWTNVREQFTGVSMLETLRWDEIYEPALKELLAIQSDVEFWRALRGKVTALKDGRTYIRLPGNINREYDLVPIAMTVAGDKVLVKRLSEAPEVLSSGIHPGDELLTVDHVPVFEHLYKNCVKHVSASTSDGLKAEAVYRILTGRADSQAHLKLKRPDGEIYEADLKRNSGTDGYYYHRLYKDSTEALKWLQDDIIYVNFKSVLTHNTEMLFDHVLIQDRKPKGIIIDLRAARDGIVPRTVIEKLAFFPLPIGGYREVIWSADDPDKPKLGRVGRTREWREVMSEMIHPGEDVYRGPVAVLIGPETIGPAEQFLQPLVFAERVTLVGEPTAGAGGEITETLLPGGGRLWITVREPVWEKGYGAGRGFKPLIKVIPTSQGLASGKDEVVDAAEEYLQSVFR